HGGRIEIIKTGGEHNRSHFQLHNFRTIAVIDTIFRTHRGADHAATGFIANAVFADNDGDIGYGLAEGQRDGRVGAEAHFAMVDRALLDVLHADVAGRADLGASTAEDAGFRFALERRRDIAVV